MDLLAAWVLFPLAALLVCWGSGLLVGRVSHAVPGGLILPIGMAVVVCASQLTTYWSWSARATLPLVLLLALAGFLTARRKLRERPDPYLAATMTAVFAVFAAPVVFSGTATFAGYTVLGDTSIHMIGADALLQYGRDFSSLPPSSYEYSLVGYYGANGYPSGGPTAVGALTSLVHQDVAWTFQPFLSLLVALTAAQLWSLLTPHVERRSLRAVLAFIAAQPSLVFAYAMQGSVKEVGTAWAVLLLAALIPPYVTAPPGPRRTIPLAVASGALIGVVGAAGIVWLGPLLLVALGAALIRTRPSVIRVGLEVAAFGILAALLMYQTLIQLRAYVEVSGSVVTAQQEFGNLLGPLDPLHILGVWLTGDYRIPPADHLTTSHVLSWFVAAAGVVGVVGLVVRRSWYLVAFLAVSFIAYWYVTANGSPWADGKAMTIVSPVVMLAAVLGAAFLGSVGRPAFAWAVAAVLAVGVIWSNALQFHDVSLAPRDRLTELEKIGEEFSGQGPLLYSEFEEFGKHFLRRAAPEGSSEGWQRRFALAVGRNGQLPLFGIDTDIDQYSDAYLTYYRSIVMPRGFFGSRPSSIYRRIHHGRFYDVWQRAPDGADRLIRHEPLGEGRNPSAPAPCATVRSVATTARQAGGRIAFAELPQIYAFVPSETAIPRGWYPDTVDGNVLQARGEGLIEDSIRLPMAGRHSLWVEGSFRRDWEVAVDGRRIASVQSGLEPRYGAQKVADVELPPGRHVITLHRPGGTVWPGNGGPDALGPVVLAPPEVDTRPAATIDPSDWKSLCGRSLDWVEAVRG